MIQYIFQQKIDNYNLGIYYNKNYISHSSSENICLLSKLTRLIYEFKLLSTNEQAQATWDNGILLGFREQPPAHMILYRIDNFYVEIQYHSEKNEITRIKSFISDKPLDPYLDKIDITSLF